MTGFVINLGNHIIRLAVNEAEPMGIPMDEHVSNIVRDHFVMLGFDHVSSAILLPALEKVRELEPGTEFTLPQVCDLSMVPSNILHSELGKKFRLAVVRAEVAEFLEQRKDAAVYKRI